MGIGFSELLVILVVVLILFGAGKLPSVMSEMGKGVKNFKAGLKDETPETATPVTTILPADQTKPLQVASDASASNVTRDTSAL